MRVLSITPSFLPQRGGVEQVVLELALGVRSHGVQMDIAHIAPDVGHCSESVEGILVHRISLRGNRKIGWAPALRAVARGYDLLHVHDPQLLAITANVRCSCGNIPAVLSTHGGFWHTNRSYLLKRIYESTFLRGAAGHYRRVLASSVADFEYYRRYVNRVVLCNNGVNVERFNAVQHTGHNELHRWIYWGRLTRHKRVDLAINYVAHARALGHPVQFLICGQDVDGLMPELKAQVLLLGLETSVRFEQFLDDASLTAELNEHTVYITASQHEGFGISIVEAMAAGLIVVCRDRPPLNGFFSNGQSGWFLQFDGSKTDIKGLNEFLSRPPANVATMAAAAREAASKYDWALAAPRFVQHYRQVMSGGPPDERHE